MIVVKIDGRLGNQLFQYAFAYSQSKKLKTRFLLDNETVPFVLSKYFRIKRKKLIYFIQNKYIRKLLRYLIRKRFREKNHIKISNWTLFNDSCIVNDAYYDGYFQSLSFFERDYKQIKHQFAIKDKYIEMFRDKYENLFSQNKTLVIHIRRTDYLIYGINMKDLGGTSLYLPLSYYKNCLDKIENLNRYKILLVGDDVEFMKSNFSFLPNVSFEQNDMIIDFQLIMNADAIIMSNSTFAWWATYLNDKKEKVVYAPKYFCGFHICKEYPNGISYNLPYIWEEVI